MSYKVSVIVPIYKVEKFIEHSVRSLMEQTLPEVEYIFVNDASTDKSFAILKKVISEYTNRVRQIVFLEHKVNKGLPAARNTGLSVATGKYVFHCDSDDFIEFLEKKHQCSKKLLIGWLITQEWELFKIHCQSQRPL